MTILECLSGTLSLMRGEYMHFWLNDNFILKTSLRRGGKIGPYNMYKTILKYLIRI